MALKRRTVTVDNRMSKRFKPSARARKARGVTAAVKRLIADKTEFKVVNTNLAITPNPAVGFVHNMIPILQGDTVADRSGNVVNITSNMVDIRVYAPQDGGIDDVVQIMLVWDATPNGVAPTYGQIMKATAGQFGQNFKDFQNDDERFTILWAERSSIYAGSDTNYAQWDNCMYRKYISIDQKLSSPKTRYADNVAIPTSGGLWLIGAGNQASATLNQNSSVSYTSCTRYTDK